MVLVAPGGRAAEMVDPVAEWVAAVGDRRVRVARVAAITVAELLASAAREDNKIKAAVVDRQTKVVAVRRVKAAKADPVVVPVDPAGRTIRAADRAVLQAAVPVGRAIRVARVAAGLAGVHNRRFRSRCTI